jgi:hypothetical protein
MSVSETIIAVHFGDAFTAMTPEIFPARNRAGALLLSGFLKLALSDCLSEGEPFGITGELNDCVFMASVGDEAAAVEIIKNVLQPIGLLNQCQIGVHRPEGWHCVYPSSEVRMAWLLDTERHDHGFAQFKQAAQCKQEAMASLLAQVKNLLDQQGNRDESGK